jgi:hypothetical protein
MTMRSPKQRLQGAIDFIVDTAVECVSSCPENEAEAPETVDDVGEYLLRVWEEPLPGLDCESELRGALCCAYHLLPGSVERVRGVLARAVHEALRGRGLLRHQRNAA